MEHTAAPDDFYAKALQPFGEWVSRPMQEETFDFGKHRDYTSQAREIIQNLAKASGLNKVADEFVFFDRTVYGLCKIFERMGAKVRIREHWVAE